MTPIATPSITQDCLSRVFNAQKGLEAHSPVQADHPIRFLFAKQWHQEVPRQLIHHVPRRD